MWLLPVISPLARFALDVFYRFEVAGGRVPARGPVLLVANHPNSLLDPASVFAVAGRPIRFLAKAPLFSDRLVGWLVRGAGALPVYRRQDDPSLVGRNEDVFRAVHAALADGSAVGIFPEGTSHSEPALAPLKTGAARIALGAAAILGGAFPIVPVGLGFREKETFRSDALALIGEPVAWDDLAGRPVDDAEAVRALTARIEEALHAVTLNLERWEDAPLVETAEAVWTAELGADPAPAARVARTRGTTAALARMRAEGDERWRALARELRAHRRLLRRVGMRPHELHDRASGGEALSWTLRRGLFFGVAAPLALFGALAYAVPYRLTGWIERRARANRDVRATWKLLVGGALHLAWTGLAAVAAGVLAGGWAAAAVLVGMPLLGLAALRVRETWLRAEGEARRFVVRTRRGDAVRTLRERQRRLAGRLREAWEEVGV